MPQGNMSPSSIVGNQLCYTHTTATDGIITIAAKLDCMGSVLSVLIPRNSEVLTVCEVQVYTVPYNMCKLF